MALLTAASGRWSCRENDVHIEPNQIGRSLRQQLRLEPVLGREVFALNVAQFSHTPPEGGMHAGLVTDTSAIQPITGIAGCCARATSGHAVAPAITDMNSRRLIAFSQCSIKLAPNWHARRGGCGVTPATALKADNQVRRKI